MSMTPYEQKSLAEVHRWQAAAPGWGTRLLAKPGGKLAAAVQVLVPASALRAALSGADRLGRRLADERSLLKRAGVGELAALRDQSLETCDGLARSVALRALALGGISGAAFGVAGGAGLVADVPALLTLSMRTIHRTGLCYGEKPAAAPGLSLAIFAVVSANSAEEKAAALAGLRDGGAAFDAAWRDGVERMAGREFAKEATTYSLQNLAKSIGLNLGRRKVAGTIPLIGAAVGAAVNASYLSDVAQAARYVFQERWLAAKYPSRMAP